MAGGNSSSNNKSQVRMLAGAIIAPSGYRQTAPPRSPGRPPIPPTSYTQVREQDCYMPIANVVRIMRKAIPPNGKISDETKETVQECVTEFISFITEEANQKVCEEHRKTINGDDLIWAMRRLGFDTYADALEPFLIKYREMDGNGLTKSELASRQRRHANRSAGIQIGSTASPPPISGSRAPIATIRGRLTSPSILLSPAVMPPIPMINPHDEIVSYINDGPFSSPEISAGFNSTEGKYPSSSNPNRGPTSSMSFDLPNVSSPTSSDEAEMNFLNRITNFK